MAGLVARIKSKVHRRSGSSKSGTSVSEKQQDLADQDGTPEDLNQQSAPIGPARLSLEHSAFHVSRGVNKRSIDVEDPNGSDKIVASNMKGSGSQTAEPDTNFDEHVAVASNRPGQPVVDDLVPKRHTSLRVLGQSDAPISSETYRTYERYADGDIGLNTSNSSDEGGETVRTSEKISRKPLPNLPQESGNSKSPVPALQHHSSSSSLSISDDESDHVVSLDKAAAGLNLGSKHDFEHAEHANEHLRLPEGFDLSNTEETHVVEEHQPAVTHETIFKDRAEIVQEAITRDIHVHHYYTYMQPVKVVEVLPAKHFLLDPKTGVKTEIPTPAGWELPKSMLPTSPNTSAIKGWTRHYLVNEAHPQGVLEDAPTS